MTVNRSICAKINPNTKSSLSLGGPQTDDLRDRIIFCLPSISRYIATARLVASTWVHTFKGDIRDAMSTDETVCTNDHPALGPRIPHESSLCVSNEATLPPLLAAACCYFLGYFPKCTSSVIIEP